MTYKYIKIIVLSVLLFQAFTALATNTDSLLQIYNTMSDIPVNDLISLTEKYIIQSKYDSAATFISIGLNKATRKNNKAALNKLKGDIFYHRFILDTAMNYYSLSYSLLQKNQQKLLVDLAFYTGVIYEYWGQKDSAEHYYNLSLATARKIGFKKAIPMALNGLGNIYSVNGNYEKGLEYYNEALKVAKQEGFIEEIAKALLNIGIVYYFLEKYDIALDYYNDALSLAQEAKNSHGEALILGNIGNVYELKQEYTKAIQYYKQALDIQKKNNDFSSLANTYINIGSNYFKNNNSDVAIEYYTKGLNMSYKANDRDQEAIALYHLGEIYLQKKNYPLSEKQLLECIRLTAKIKSAVLKKEALLKISGLYEETNQLNKAIFYYKWYSNLKDTLLNEENQKKITEFRTKYETEKKQHKIDKLTRIKEIQELQIQKDRNKILLYLVLSILVFLLAVFLFWRNRIRIKTNRILGEKNNKLQLLNATKDKFFAIIAHDLKNPLSAFRTITSSLSENVEELDHTEIEYFLNELKQSSKSLYELLQNLLQWSRSQIGLVKCTPIAFVLADAINEIITLQLRFIQSKKIKVIIDIDKKITVYTDKNIVQTVFRNLLNNAIKFTPQNGRIQLNARIMDKYVRVNVTDNGIGLSEEDMKKLFRIDINTSTIGSAKEKGTGLGLILCKELLEKCEGKIWVESQLNIGSTFYFTIPLSANNETNKDNCC